MAAHKTRNRKIGGFDLMEERIAPSGGVVPVYYGTPPAPIVHGSGGGGGGSSTGGGGGGGGGGSSTGLPDTFVH